MNNPFEQLDKRINELIKRLDKLEEKLLGEKRWLNIKEASYYLGYSKDHLHKLKSEYFIEGTHYHKKAGRVLFDKVELDNWVTASINMIDPKKIADEVLKGLT